MKLFTIIAGIASILSLILSILAISKVYILKAKIGDKILNKSNQRVRAKRITLSDINQVGRDKIEKTNNKIS
ncbi:hypothetical protein FJZ31_01440 [Candidatus Poribacteria bacterium]|nr:hypothetical protein [Candidatus Poribacteria bacterium]